MHLLLFSIGRNQFEDETKAGVTVNFMPFLLSLSECIVRSSHFFSLLDFSLRESSYFLSTCLNDF